MHLSRQLLLLAALVTAATISNSAHAATGGPDPFGYTFSDNRETGSGNTWINITTTGTVVVSNGDNSSSNSPTDGIGAPVKLGFPFTFYGQSFTHAVPTTNGYLSFDPAETGADATNDCPLPPTPDIGTGPRIYAYHRDLNFNNSQAKIYYQYFDRSDQYPLRGGVSVFTWHRAALGLSSTVTIDFQVLLFDNGDILIHHDTGGLDLTLPATIGIQDGTGNSRLASFCNGSGSIKGQVSTTFELPTIQITSTAPGAIQAAINSLPAGGKIYFPAAYRTHDYPQTIVVNKPIAFTSDLADIAPGFGNDTEAFTKSLFFKQIRWDIRDRALFYNTEFSGATGTTISVATNSSVKLAYSEIFSAADHSITANANSHVHLFFSRIESPSPGSSHLLELMSGSTLKLISCVLSDSHADAIRYIGSGSIPTTPNITIQSSAIVNNTSYGLWANRARINVNNSTLSNNGRAAVYATVCQITSAHNTIVQNRLAFDLALASNVNTHHSILAENIDPLTGTLANLRLINSSSLTSSGYNLIDEPNPLFNATGDITNTSPHITPLGIYNQDSRFPMFAHLPLAGSPVINVGGFGSSDTLPTDQRGFPRLADGNNTGSTALDLGSVELGPFILVTTHIDETTSSPNNTGTSLREACSIATNHHVIRFSPTLDGQTINLSKTSNGQGTTIGTFAFIDASNLPNGIEITGASVVDQPLISTPAAHGLTLTHGRMRAARNTNSSPLPEARIMTFSHCKFIGNEADPATYAPNRIMGGAIWNDGILHVNHCQFIGNRANYLGTLISGYGGAIANVANTTRPTAHIVNCLFEGNQSLTRGGAIVSSANGTNPDRCRIDRCTFTNNQADDGGAVRFGNSNTQRYDSITNSTFHNNTANTRGGAVASANSAYIRHSTFHENFANNTYGRGGSIYASGEIIIDHSTITDNQCELGGGIHLDDATLTISNSILDNNYGTFNGILTPHDFNISPSSSVVSLGHNISRRLVPEFHHPTDLTATPPLLGPLTSNGGSSPTRHPLANSPLINAGSNSTPFFDQRGYSGRVGSATDIGAVEVAPALIVNTTTDEFDSPSGPNLSLREAIRDSPVGGRILFDENALAGFNSIDLSTAALGQGTELVINKDLTIDATSLSRGITIDAAPNSRCLTISPGNQIVTLHAISFTDGNPTSSGGAIFKAAGANLTLTESAIHNNHCGGNGAGIWAGGTGQVSLQNVTISNNHANGFGGGIVATSSASLDLSHCTIVDNTNITRAAGIDLSNNATMEMFYTILAQNLRGSTLANFSSTSGSIATSNSKNITDGSAPTWFNAGDLSANPLIGALTDTGGFAKVHPPLPLSPIVNAGNPNAIITAATDARGQPRIYGGSLDIGAMELGSGDIDSDNDGIPNEWEIYYGMNPNNPTDATLDLDGDGQTSLEEFLTQTLPNQRNSTLQSRAIASTTTSGTINSITVNWNSVPSVNYEIWFSTDLGTNDPWTKAATIPARYNEDITNTILSDPSLLNSTSGFFQIRIKP